MQEVTITLEGDGQICGMQSAGRRAKVCTRITRATHTSIPQGTGTGHTEQGQVGENRRNKPTPSEINK